MVVTALGNPEIGIPGRRGQNPLPALIRGMNVADVAGPQALGHHLVHRLGDIPVASGAQNAVHLRQFLQDVLLVPLGHAARHQNFPDLPGLLQRRHLQNIVDGLFAGGGQKAAGVHHHNVGALRLCLHRVAGRLNRRHHLFAVHLVFGAAQGDK